MFTHLVAYAATAVVFFAVDFVWLSTASAGIYRPRLGALLLEQPNLMIAGLFYLFYVGGIVYFAVSPALAEGGWSKALVAGLVLGFVAYGTYDLTNLSTLRNWPWSVTLVDLAWGTALTGLAAMCGFFITQYFVR
ncbi:DUF2177 family protein [Devosia sp.]|uniref:DUF2177 family protein n=1 Tax=Devosia sp. TaxID=1871048 RepID=UPI002AFEDFED|nr:DUF2177 family protein [Devosia sp.]